MVLVDSTVWIDLLRKSETQPVRLLHRLIDAGEAAVAPVVVQELLQGATHEVAFGKLHGYFTAIPTLGADNPVELHVAAGRLYARARWRGITPRSPHDCLVAATAVHKDVLLLHDDQDFERLAHVEPRLRLIPRR